MNISSRDYFLITKKGAKTVKTTTKAPRRHKSMNTPTALVSLSRFAIHARTLLARSESRQNY